MPAASSAASRAQSSRFASELWGSVAVSVTPPCPGGCTARRVGLPGKGWMQNQPRPGRLSLLHQKCQIIVPFLFLLILACFCFGSPLGKPLPLPSFIFLLVFLATAFLLEQVLCPGAVLPVPSSWSNAPLLQDTELGALRLRCWRRAGLEARPQLSVLLFICGLQMTLGSQRCQSLLVINLSNALRPLNDTKEG